MTTKTTIAKRVAERLGNDGQVFEVPAREGEPVDDRAREEGHTSIDALADAAGGRKERNDRDPDLYRWVFADGSVLTVTASAWDYGFAGCWCWREAGHREECEQKAEG